MAKKLWSMLGAMSVVIASVACGSTESAPTSEQTAPAAETLSDGLTVLKSTNKLALNVAFKKDNQVILIQALRGKLAPPEYQAPEAEPVYEVDARFVADNGRTFYSRKGGDEWIDPTWAKDFERQSSLAPTRVSNEKLFRLAAEAAAQLDVSIAKQLDAESIALHKPELRAITEFGLTAPTVFADERVRLDAHLKKIGDTATEIPYGDMGGADEANKTMSGNYYYIAVHDKSLWYSFGTGRHSATRLYQWQGYWQWVHDSCNHGTCAGGMGQKCLLNYNEALDDWKPTWEYQNCKTGYSATSNDGGHNCHDDTRVQLAGFVYSKTNNGSQAWCADGDSSADISGGFEQGGSPDCSAYQRKGYNHPSWCGYDGGGNSCPDSWRGDGLCDCNCKFSDGTGADPDCRNK